MMIQHGEHIEKGELDEDVMHDELYMEGQLQAHVDPMMKEDELPYFGSTIDKGHINAQATSRVAVLLDNNPLHEYIDKACSMVCPLLSILKRGARFPRQVLLIDWAQLHELSMVQHSGLVPYIGAHASNPFHRMDWRDIMSWYPINGPSFLVRSIVQQGPLDVRDTTCSSWQWDVSSQFISIPVALAQHQHSGVDLGLCQGLDWTKVMSWYWWSIIYGQRHPTTRAMRYGK